MILTSAVHRSQKIADSVTIFVTRRSRKEKERKDLHRIE